MSKEYGWTPEQVARLTLTQATAYLSDDEGAMDSGRLTEARMKFARAAALSRAADERAKRRANRGR